MSDSVSVATLEAKGPKGVGIRVEFLKLGDRFTHRFVAFNEAGEERLLAEAIEDDLEADWPYSPVLQELNLEKIGENTERVAMLVGKAGDAHWSVVIRPDVVDTACGFIVESACRVKSMPDRLGSSYLLGDQVKQLASGVSASLETSIGTFRISALPMDQPQSSPCRLAIQQKRIQILPENGQPDGLPTTIQWRYGVWLM